MKPIKVDKDAKGVKVTFANEKQEKQKQRRAKFAAILDKKAKNKLILEDIDDKLNIIIEMLNEIIDEQKG